MNDFTRLKRRSQTSNIVMKTVSHVDQRESQSTGLELESRGNTPKASTHDHNVDVSRGDLTAHNCIRSPDVLAYSQYDCIPKK